MNKSNDHISCGKVHFNQNSQSLEATLKTDAHQNEHSNDVKTLSEALMTINAKEELVKQHVKVAEEAVSGINHYCSTFPPQKKGVKSKKRLLRSKIYYLYRS